MCTERPPFSGLCIFKFVMIKRWTSGSFPMTFQLALKFQHAVASRLDRGFQWEMEGLQRPELWENDLSSA
ncbi:hypothetical protein ACRRTK_010522 [Alexandromys fortis]